MCYEEDERRIVGPSSVGLVMRNDTARRVRSGGLRETSSFSFVSQMDRRELDCRTINRGEKWTSHRWLVRLLLADADSKTQE